MKFYSHRKGARMRGTYKSKKVKNSRGGIRL